MVNWVFPKKKKKKSFLQSAADTVRWAVGIQPELETWTPIQWQIQEPDQLEQVNIESAQEQIKPTVATTSTPVVERVTKIEDEQQEFVTPNFTEQSEEELQDFVDKISTKIDFWEIPSQEEVIAAKKAKRLLTERQKQALWRDKEIWEAEAQLTTRKEQQVKNREKLIEQKKKQLQTQFQERLASLEDATQRQKEAAQNVLSFSWFGRSTFAADRQAQIQDQFERSRAALELARDNALELERRRLEWEDAESLAPLSQRIQELRDEVFKSERQSLATTDALNQQASLAFDEKLANLLEISKKNIEKRKEDEDVFNANTIKSIEFFAGLVLDEEWNINKDIYKDIPDRLKSFVLEKAAQNKLDRWVRWDVDAFAQEIIEKWKTSVTVPEDLRVAVQRRVRELREQQVSVLDKLTDQQLTAAKNLSVQLFGKSAWAKNENVALIWQQLADWKTVAQIEDDLRNQWFGSEFTWDVKTIFNKLTTRWFTKDEKENNRNVLEDLVSDFGRNSNEVREFILQLADDRAWETTRRQIQWRTSAIDVIWQINSKLNDFINKWWDTSLLTWLTEQTLQKLGQTMDPELAAIANDIRLAIQSYRQSVSWAAFSESEAQEYEDIFPSSGKSWELNKALIDSLLRTFGRNINSYYRQSIWTKYNNLFPDWAIPVLIWEDETSWVKITNINELPDDEKTEIDSIFSETPVTTVEKTQEIVKETPWWTEYKSKSWKTFKLSFNQADQTAQTKESVTIQSDIDRVAKWSPITWDMVVTSANKFNISPALLWAFLRNDSNFGTKGLWATNNNPWNVWQFDRFGKQAVKWFETIEEWIDAAWSNLQKRVNAFRSKFNREPTAKEIASWISNEWTKFFWPYMTEAEWPNRVQQIFNQLNK